MKKVKRMYKNIKKVQAKTGYSIPQAYLELRKAKKIGFKYSEYISGELWDKSEKVLKLLSERKKYAETVSKLTGWSYAHASEHLVKARKLGINANSYMNYFAYELNDSELNELSLYIKKLAQKYNRDREWQLKVVMEHTGWDYAFTKERMDTAVSKGYTYRKFITSALYKLNDIEFSSIPEFKGSNSFTTSIMGSKTYRSSIKEEMNWNDGQLNLDFLKKRVVAGASFDEYYLYRLFKLSPEESTKYITMETHLKMQLRYCDYGGDFSYFDDKGRFCDTFKTFIKRKYFLTNNLAYGDFTKEIAGFDYIVVKPINGLAGAGVEKFKVNSNSPSNKEIFDIIMQKGDCIVEECLTQHKDIAAFYPDSVNTIRIMSLYKDNQCNILNSVIKFGTSTVADNLAEGGIAAGIDIKTGIIVTDGVNKKGEIFKSHPITGKTFKGSKIPYWDMVLETCISASKVIPNMPYIGWDIAIKDNGEIAIIEGNHNQAGFLVQFPFAISEQQGMRHNIDPYLWFQ